MTGISSGGGVHALRPVAERVVGEMRRLVLSLQATNSDAGVSKACDDLLQDLGDIEEAVR